VRAFTDSVWLGEVRAWIESHVEVTGEIEQPHVRPGALLAAAAVVTPA
jgi:hypothetical protein